MTRVNNTGAAFGMWRNGSSFLIAVTTLSVVAISFYLVGHARSAQKVSINFYGWALVVGGALGNLYDRVHFGYVVDFLDIRV